MKVEHNRGPRAVRRALLAPAAAIALAGCGGPAAAPVGAPPPPPVVVVAAVARDVPVYLDEIGRCVASESVVVMPRVTGAVASVTVKDGADLAAGAPLFLVDPRPYEARLAEARARQKAAEAATEQSRSARASAAAHVTTAKSKRDQARAQVTVARAMADAAAGEAEAAASDAARARADRERMEALGTSGAVSQQDLARMRTDASAAEAKLAAARQRVGAAEAQAIEAQAAQASAEQGIAEAEAQLLEVDARIESSLAEVQQAVAAVETARLDTEFCSIASPIAGRAGNRRVDVGSVVTANVTALLSIQRTDPIHVEFSVPEKDLAAIQRAMAARTLKAEVRLPDDETPREGNVTFLDSAVEAGTGTVRLRVTLANADAHLWPGRFARVRMLLDTLRGAVLVPAAATQVSAFGPIVYVLKPGKDPATGAPITTADLRPVTVGQRQGDQVVLVRGVEVGEPVIVERSMLVYPGARVTVVEPPRPPGGAPPGTPGASKETPTEKPAGGAR